MSITSDFDVPVSHKPIEVESKLPEVVLVVSHVGRINKEERRRETFIRGDCL